MKYIGALSVFALLSVFAWPLATAAAVSPISSSTPYCQHVIQGEYLVQQSRKTPKGQIFYQVFRRQSINESLCNIDNGHSLQIQFRQRSKVSDVLIQDLALVKDLSKLSVSLWKGNETFECKPPKDEPSMSKQVQFHSFSCFKNGAYQPDGFFANGVEIKSSEMVPVNLTHLIKTASFGWLLLKQESTVESEDPGSCNAPALTPGQRIVTTFKNVYQEGEIVKFECEEGLELEPVGYYQTCQKSGDWSPPQLALCQPSTDSAQWYGTVPVFSKYRVWAGATNVSLVAAFRRNIYNVSKVGVALIIPFEKDEMKSLFDNNIVYQLMNANGDIIYEHRIKQVNTTEKTSITTTFPDKVPHCSMCTVIVTFPNHYWDAMIVHKLYVYGSAGFTTVGHQACPPIEPYSGMPSHFGNYELVMSGSINELLLKSPCRYGYILTGNASDINQCNNGSWIGKSFPRCERVVRPKAPPEVEHATWKYVRNNLFDIVIYTCKEGYKSTSSGSVNVVARYSVNDDSWTDVPNCSPEIHEALMQGATGRSSSSIAFIAGGVGTACSLVAAVVVLGIYLRRRRTLIIVKSSPHHVKQPIGGSK